MAQQQINHGATPGDGTGESMFAAFGKVNANFSDVYGGKHRPGQWHLDARIGSLTEPVASIDGAEGFFTLPGGNLLIPAGMLVPGKSLIEIDAAFRRRQVADNTPATVSIAVIFAAAPAFSGPQIVFSNSLTAAVNRDAAIKGRLSFTAGRVARDGNLPAGGGTGTFNEASGAHIDHTQPMYVAFHASGSKAGTSVNDIIDLVFASVRVNTTA